MQEILKRADKATKELKIRVNRKSQVDYFELAEVLVSILDYPDIDKAKQHKNANRLGNYNIIAEQEQLASRVNKNENTLDNNICECCGLIVNTEKIPFCTPLEQINLGLGTQLFFSTILYNVLIFALAFGIFSIYSLILNLQSCKNIDVINCGVQGIGLNYRIIDAVANEQSLRISSILGIVLVIVWGFIEVVKNHKQKLLAIQMDKKSSQSSDFTLMIEKYPSVYIRPTYEETLEEVKRIFKRYQQNMQTANSYDVVKVNVARNLYTENYNKQKVQENLDQQLKEKQKKFKDWILQRQKHQQFSTIYQKREIQYENYYKFYTNDYERHIDYKGNHDQNVIIFVTLRWSKAVQQIQINTRPSTPINFFNLCNKNKFPLEKVDITKAPPPEQIKWLNIGFPSGTKIFRTITVYLISLIFIAASLGLTVGLNKLRYQSSEMYVSILISFGITVFNFLLQFSILIMSKYLNEITETKVQFNIAFKICLFQLINVIGVPLLALYILKRSLFGQNGLSSDIFFIALFNILVPIGRFIDPYFLLISFRNRYYESPCKYTPLFLEKRLLNFNGQRQFNKIYQDNDFDLGYEYAYIIKTSIFTSFFMCLQPIIALFAAIGLIMFWLVSKYRVYYRFYKPRFFSQSVNSLVGYLLNISPFAFGLGLLVFTNWQDEFKVHNTSVLNWIICAIGVFFFFFPFRLMYHCVTKPQFSNWDFEQKRAILPSEYDRMNPVTRQIAINEHKQYLKDLQNKQVLPQTSKYLNQSVLRNSQANDLRRSIGASEIGLRRSNMKVKQSRIIGGKSNKKNNENSSGGNHYKPSYNQNIDSYEDLIKNLNKGNRNQQP